MNTKLNNVFAKRSTLLAYAMFQVTHGQLKYI